MKKPAKKPSPSKKAIKDLALNKKKGASAAAKKIKGGFAPQPEPPKEIKSSISRSIRPY